VHPWINCFWSHGFLTLHQTSSHHLLADSDGSQKFGSPKSEMYSHKDIKNFSPVCWVLTFFFESQHTDMSFVVVESAKQHVTSLKMSFYVFFHGTLWMIFFINVETIFHPLTIGASSPGESLLLSAAGGWNITINIINSNMRLLTSYAQLYAAIIIVVTITTSMMITGV